MCISVLGKGTWTLTSLRSTLATCLRGASLSQVLIQCCQLGEERKDSQWRRHIPARSSSVRDRSWTLWYQARALVTMPPAYREKSLRKFQLADNGAELQSVTGEDPSVLDDEPCELSLGWTLRPYRPAKICISSWSKPCQAILPGPPSHCPVLPWTASVGDQDSI